MADRDPRIEPRIGDELTVMGWLVHVSTVDDKHVHFTRTKEHMRGFYRESMTLALWAVFCRDAVIGDGEAQDGI